MKKVNLQLDSIQDAEVLYTAILRDLRTMEATAENHPAYLILDGIKTRLGDAIDKATKLGG